MKLTKIIATVGVTGAIAVGAVGAGAGIANAEPGWGPHPGPGWNRGPGGPADWYHPEWNGWNNGYPAAGWIPPQGWAPPPDWNNPGGWAPPPDYQIPCGGPLWNLFHPLRCW